MRHFLPFLFLPVFLYSCRSVTCAEPTIQLKYDFLDSLGYLPYKFERYEKDGNFSKLLSSETDTARYGGYGTPLAKYTSLDASADYIITVPVSGRRYAISDISYSGQKKTTDGMAYEMSRAVQCTRTISYKVNGENVKVEGSSYERYYGSAPKVELTISK